MNDHEQRIRQLEKDLNEMQGERKGFNTGIAFFFTLLGTLLGLVWDKIVNH